MFYSQIILAKKGPLAKVWLAAHHGEKKLARPQIFATDIPQTVMDICNPSVPLALRVSGHLLLGVVRIYSRKVKYVLHDCTEAMLKLQMAFSTTTYNAGGTGSGGDLDLPQTNNHHNSHITKVVNFGEYDQVHVVEGFCLPLDTETDWILAEEEDDHAVSQGTAAQGGTQGEGDHDLDDTFLTTQPEYEATTTQPSPEQWVPFDPEEEETPFNQSFVSDVEVPRAANDDSFLSNDQTRRASTLATPSSKQNEEDHDFPPMDQDDDDDMAAVPFDDDDEEPQPNNVSGLDPSSSLHASGVDVSGTTTGGVSIGGLADDQSLNSTNTNHKRTATPLLPKAKPRKRRKVVIDNDATELSNDHIKSMIADTGDLRTRKSHPADWNPNMTTTMDTSNQDHHHKNHNPTSLWRPFLAQQEGACHPALQELWNQSYYQALEQPCSFAKKQQQPQEEHDEVEDGSIEETRRQQEEEEEEQSMDVPVNMDDDDVEFPNAAEQEPQDMGDTVWPEDDDEEEPPQDEDLDQHDSLAFATDMADMQSPGQASALDLGMVNELQVQDQDDDDETRQALGDKEGTAQKWHQHTVKVLQMLQRTMSDNDEKEQQQQVSYDALSKNCSRRTAASVFFELLQLKTWDFIEIDQQDPYGDIEISAGLRFQEAPPNSN